MTIQMQHLTIAPTTDEWVRSPEDGADVTTDETYAVDILSMVRHIMRERGDCNIIPIVRAVVVHPENKWGHNAQIEVTYHTRGYRAIYGAHIAGRVSRVQCYMD